MKNIEVLALSIAVNQFTVPLPTGKEIVRAVNSHAALVDVVKHAAGYPCSDRPKMYAKTRVDMPHCLGCKARAALKLAG